MPDDFHNANDLLKEMEGLAIKTSAGEFVRKEDVVRLIEKREAAKAITDEETPKPKTVEQARSLARKYLKENQPQLGPREPGRSIPATEPQPPSRA